MVGCEHYSLRCSSSDSLWFEPFSYLYRCFSFVLMVPHPSRHSVQRAFVLITTAPHLYHFCHFSFYSFVGSFFGSLLCLVRWFHSDWFSDVVDLGIGCGSSLSLGLLRWFAVCLLRTAFAWRRAAALLHCLHCARTLCCLCAGARGARTAMRAALRALVCRAPATLLLRIACARTSLHCTASALPCMLYMLCLSAPFFCICIYLAWLCCCCCCCFCCAHFCAFSFCARTHFARARFLRAAAAFPARAPARARAHAMPHTSAALHCTAPRAATATPRLYVPA